MLYRRFRDSFDNPLWLSDRCGWLYWRIYQFSWSNYFWLFENRIAKSSVFATAAGYLIFLNDLLTDHFGFETVTRNSPSALGLDLASKLHLVFFGLLLIAIARAIYLFGRPASLRFGPSETEYVNFGLKNFTYGDFWDLHKQVRNEGHRTRYGKYYDDLWDAFADDATWREAGRYTSDAKDRKRQDRARYDYTQAKSRHEDLLRSLLIDRYCEFSAKNKPGLFLALAFAVPGYVMFLLPSLDLTITILMYISD